MSLAFFWLVGKVKSSSQGSPMIKTQTLLGMEALWIGRRWLSKNANVSLTIWTFPLKNEFYINGFQWGTSYFVPFTNSLGVHLEGDDSNVLVTNHREGGKTEWRDILIRILFLTGWCIWFVKYQIWHAFYPVYPSWILLSYFLRMTYVCVLIKVAPLVKLLSTFLPAKLDLPHESLCNICLFEFAED